VGLGLIVEGHELHFVAHLLQVALHLLDGELRAELDALAQRSLTAGERTLGGDLDGALGLGTHGMSSLEREPGNHREQGEGAQHVAGSKIPHAVSSSKRVGRVGKRRHYSDSTRRVNVWPGFPRSPPRRAGYRADAVPRRRQASRPALLRRVPWLP